MDLNKARRLVEACFRDPALEARYAQADTVSKNQTKHDLPHAFEVKDLAAEIVGYVDAKQPGLLTDEERHVITPLAAFLHDNGRAEDVKRHALLGARWANTYLGSLTLPDDSETLSAGVTKRVVRTIACHSADLYIKAKFRDFTTDIVVLADKCIGDAERVRGSRARAIRITSWFRATWIAARMRDGGEHDVVNYAIKQSRLVRDGDTLVLRMNIDERICGPQYIWSVRWNRQAYQCCFVASQRLGFGFELEFNGVRYVNFGEGDWRAK